MTIRDFVNKLPYRLRHRFDSLGAYVKSVIDADETDLPKKRRLTRDQVQFIQLVVFVHSLDFFLREGTKAARGAVASLETLGVPGFVVGSTSFQGENENVVRGEELANRLRSMVQQSGIFSSILNDMTPTDLTRELRKQLLNG